MATVPARALWIAGGVAGIAFPVGQLEQAVGLAPRFLAKFASTPTSLIT